jgi:hypothetical protein
MEAVMAYVEVVLRYLRVETEEHQEKSQGSRPPGRDLNSSLLNLLCPAEHSR